MPFVNKFKILVCTACLMLVGQGFAMDSWIDHKSTKTPDKTGDCYQIKSAGDLAWYADFVNKQGQHAVSCAELQSDIDLSGNFWVPISYKGVRHKVNFNGNGFIISNLYINAEYLLDKYPPPATGDHAAQNLGLIGAFEGHVQNVILENVEIYGYGRNFATAGKDPIKNPLSIGTVVGWQTTNASVVENCYVTGKMVTSGDGQAVGGIVGNNGGGTIRNCYSAVNIDASGVAYVGGIAGYTKAYDGGTVTISSCVYNGENLSSTGSGGAGAIVGNHLDGSTTFENVYYDKTKFNNGVGTSMGGSISGSPSGTVNLNSELIASTLNEGSEDNVWSAGASSICLNGYGADGYKITFNANGGSFAGGATFVKYVKAGNTINNDGVADPTWGDDSYVFAGWLGDDYNKAATKATTITASWNKMHTITFSPVNGDLHGTFPDGSSESVSIKIENGKRIAVQGFERPTTFTNDQGEKYNFVGWAFAESPTTALVADGLDNLPLATRDTTLLAVWTTAPVYTVRFFENDASTASYVSSVYENEYATELTVDKMDPHPGYTFKGWFERDAENSFDFEQVITSDVDLFAKWTKNSYTVNYELNCSDECTNSNADEFTVDGMPLSDPEWNEKYRFLGWYADAEFKDEKTSIPSGLTENISLYAKWDTVSYDITYRAGANGIGLVAAEKKVHNEAYTLRDASYTRKGYLQSGWVSEEGLTYAFGDEYSANAPLIVYPTWDTISYTITYECNGCDVSDNKKYPKSFNVESKFSIKDPASISAEYKFGGWFKNAEFSGNKNPNVAKGTTGDFTFYGKWNKIYKITYVGTDKPYCDTLYTVDDAITLRNPADSAGYTFGGWFTNENFEGDAVTGIAKGSTGDTTFYAKWVPVPYTITYNIDGEPAELTPNTYTAAEATELATPTRDGYEFDGWYDNDEYTGDKATSIAAGTTGDTTFFAKWAAVEYTATYDVNGGSMDGDVSFTFTIESGELTLATPNAREGFTFDGWLDSKTGSVLTGTFPANSFGERTLIAQWTPVLSTITVTAKSQVFEYDANPHSAECEIAADNPWGYTLTATSAEQVTDVKDGEVSASCNVVIMDGDDDITDLFDGFIEYVPGTISVKAKVVNYGGIAVTTDEDGTTAEIDDEAKLQIDIPSDVTVDHVTFNRNFPLVKYSTVVLPFSIDTNKVHGADFYSVSMLKQNGKWVAGASEVKTSQLIANTPYLLFAREANLTFDGPVTFNTSEMHDSTTIHEAEGCSWTFKGTYTKHVWGEGDPELGKVYAFSAHDVSDDIKIGKFTKFGKDAWIRPMRAYLIYESLPSSDPEPNHAPAPMSASAFKSMSSMASIENSDVPEWIDVVIIGNEDEQTTPIARLNTQTGEVKMMNGWFDMKGRKLNGKPTVKGIYYNNGKRVIVK